MVLTLTRPQILGFRRWVAGLQGRAHWRSDSLQRAAWAGLSDSMPRAAMLSLHARVRDVRSSVLEDSSLIQLWGPRYSVYVTSVEDRGVFTLGRWPETQKARERATLMAARSARHLGGQRRPYDKVGEGLGINPNALRYATTTGEVLLRWEGARAPLVWTLPPPDIDPEQARSELARRYLHVFGPGTPASFARWAGVTERAGRSVSTLLAEELMAVRTPLGQAWMLASDEEAVRAQDRPVAATRLLPSGDAYYLVWGPERELLVPDSAHRSQLWTPRVWPGAVLLDGEIAGIWRRAQETVSVHLWRRPTRGVRDRVVTEAAGMPIPGCEGRIRVAWE